MNKHIDWWDGKGRLHREHVTSGHELRATCERIYAQNGHIAKVNTIQKVG